MVAIGALGRRGSRRTLLTPTRRGFAITRSSLGVLQLRAKLVPVHPRPDTDPNLDPTDEALVGARAVASDPYPIPLLDGGQTMVLGIEKVMSWFGKTLSIAIKEKIQLAGLAVILLLMVFTLFLDISKFF